jgi:hypothetical protein
MDSTPLKFNRGMLEFIQYYLLSCPFILNQIHIMSGKMKIAFENQSNEYIPLVIFEVTKDEKGKEAGKVVYIGGLLGASYATIELDNTIIPWASTDNRNYELGDAFNGDFRSLVRLTETRGGHGYRIDEW